MKNKPESSYFALVVLLLFPLFLSLSCDVSGSDRDIYKVKKVIDGDTVIVDAPEKLTIDTPSEPFGKRAAAYNRDLVEGKEIEVEYDDEKYDQYGRILGYVYIDEIFVNKQILEKGLANLLIIAPNNKYEEILKSAEEKAISEGAGIWGDTAEYNYNLKENSRFRVKPVNASRHLDQRVVISGKVKDTRSNDHVLKLNMEDKLDIVIFKNDLDNFRHMDINPFSHYTGTPVEVTGKVKMYRGRPQIVIDHPLSIRKIN